MSAGGWRRAAMRPCAQGPRRGRAPRLRSLREATRSRRPQEVLLAYQAADVGYAAVGGGPRR